MKQHAARLKEIAKELMAMYPDEGEEQGETSSDSEDRSDPMEMTGRKPEAEECCESDSGASKKQKMKMIVSKMAMKMGKKNYA